MNRERSFWRESRTDYSVPNSFFNNCSNGFTYLNLYKNNWNITNIGNYAFNECHNMVWNVQNGVAEKKMISVGEKAMYKNKEKVKNIG